MSGYLDTIYFREEYGEHDYPQLLCDHIAREYFSRTGDVRGKTVLDIGSGKGNHLVGFGRRGMTSVGVDKQDECVEILKEFEIRPCNLEEEALPWDDNTFDYIFSKSVLEHVFNTTNFIRESLRVLKPGGMAVLMTPDWRSQRDFFWDDYTHVKPFTRKGLQNACVINGFEKVDCSYFYQLPIVWEKPWLERVLPVFNVVPDCFKWRDKEESDFRTLIRFAKEKMLLCVASKPER
ncbi:methyltransferase domain-containing protein [uncultured Pseudodesulfovibrio sp.]|uniref:class I SAM-dependent methyltransferase n=1 Tax=uncultured Pseudodesulfovibrio sp. TaxID=2035858 RepID=UPI0029C94268|nr:methyltransferase domain-containing protein [uncultured Pseudodesulfovibrio sp.]